MTDVSLTVNGITFVFQEADITKVGSKVTGNPEQVEISHSSSMTTELHDYTGVKKMITITGFLSEASTTRVSGYSITTIIAQKQFLESLLNGSQKIIEFTSDYESQSCLSTTGATPPYQASFTSTLCMVQDFSFDQVVGDPLKCPFTIVLLVGNG